MSKAPDPREIALLCADVADDKKADDILVLDVQKILIITSYFVIATGDSRKQIQAIAEGIHDRVKPLGVRRYGVEGFEEGKWILLDYGDVIVQLFDRETRGYYNLEMIWGDAPKVPWASKQPARPREAASAPAPAARKAAPSKYAEEE